MENTILPSKQDYLYYTENRFNKLLELCKLCGKFEHILNQETFPISEQDYDYYQNTMVYAASDTIDYLPKLFSIPGRDWSKIDLGPGLEEVDLKSVENFLDEKYGGGFESSSGRKFATGLIYHLLPDVLADKSETFERIVRSLNIGQHGFWNYPENSAYPTAELAEGYEDDQSSHQYHVSAHRMARQRELGKHFKHRIVEQGPLPESEWTQAQVKELGMKLSLIKTGIIDRVESYEPSGNDQEILESPSKLVKLYKKIRGQISADRHHGAVFKVLGKPDLACPSDNVQFETLLNLWNDYPVPRKVASPSAEASSTPRFQKPVHPKRELPGDEQEAQINTEGENQHERKRCRTGNGFGL